MTTCKCEVEYHVSHQIAENESEAISNPRYYHLIKCKFVGTTVDLRSQEIAHSELVSKTDSGYPFCQMLGLEAKELNIDGFFTLSARKTGGTCVPVFSRAALSETSMESEHALIGSAFHDVETS